LGGNLHKKDVEERMNITLVNIWQAGSKNKSKRILKNGIHQLM